MKRFKSVIQKTSLHLFPVTVSHEHYYRHCQLSDGNDGNGMAVTTLRQMPHTEIDDSFKSELLGTSLRSAIKGSCLI